MTHNVNNNNHF